ncbi:MAG: Uma2 family endonuclease [Rhodopirellula sp.]|nr:Uma2 family endonuclease [Rhodopirellula sp.]
MSTVARLTLAEYDRMIAAGVFDERDNRRLELIRGELREMTPSGPEDDDLIDLLLNQWSFENAPRDRIRIRVQEPITLPTAESAPEPDIAWVVNRRYRYRRPIVEEVLLLIEVAESSLDYDRGEKAALYAEAGIADYWIVNNPEQCIEVYREPGAGRYGSVQTFSGEQEVRPLAFPEAVLRPSMLWPAGT